MSPLLLDRVVYWELYESVVKQLGVHGHTISLLGLLWVVLLLS